MSESLQERYAAIERLYSQGEWQQVLEASTALLNEIPAQQDDPLRARLSLLQGHTLLYGLGQASDAALIYQQVLGSDTEPVLQEIAQQELQRCLAQTGDQTTETPPLEPEPVAAMDGEAFPFEAQAVGGTGAGPSTAAMPWLEALGGVDPAAALQPSTLTSDQAPWLSQAAAVPTPTAAPAAPVAPQPETPPAPAAMPAADVPTAAAEVAIDPLEPAAEAPAVADVVEEPEQLEVHQADPERAEVVDLDPVVPAADGPAPKPLKSGRWSSAEAAELAKGLLTVVLR